MDKEIVVKLLEAQKAVISSYQNQIDELLEIIAKEEKKEKEEPKFTVDKFGVRTYDVGEMQPKDFEEACLQMARCVQKNQPSKYPNEKAVLRRCYMKMDKDYSAGLKGKQMEYKKQTGFWHNSLLAMISQFSGEYKIYKSIMYSILENIVGDSIEHAENVAKTPNTEKVVDESKLPKKVAYKDECTAIVIPSKVEAATTFDEAQGQIALASKLHNIRQAAIYSQIYAKMEENNGKINWCNYRYNFRKRNNLRSSVAIPKKTLIKNSPKLSKLFVKETNKFIESCNEEEETA